MLDPSLTAKIFQEMTELRKARTESLLTNRQVQILKLVADGIRYREIADQLCVSETTVNREMREVFNRMGVNDAAHAVSVAYKQGLL